MCPRTGSVSTPGLGVEEDWYVFSLSSKQSNLS